MKLLDPPSSIAHRIALAEAAISNSNARLHLLKQDLRTATREKLRASRKPFIIGGVALLALGVIAYPRRHRIMGATRRALNSPMVRTLSARLPLLGMFLPLLNRAEHPRPGDSHQGPPARRADDGGTFVAKLSAVLSIVLPLMTRLLPPRPRA